MVKVRIGAVVSEFNYDITHMMLELAKEHAKFLESEITEVITVPGVFDMPLAIKKLLKQEDIDAVVTIGAVIEGATSHDEIVIQHASRKITDLSLDFNKPVALGITGPKMTRLEAHQRIDYGKRAVEAAVKMVERLQ
jgi:6,7-dimethyl-8-ribityllumazine synthase